MRRLLRTTSMTLHSASVGYCMEVQGAGIPESATFGVNASRVILPLTIGNVNEVG